MNASFSLISLVLQMSLQFRLLLLMLIFSPQISLAQEKPKNPIQGLFDQVDRGIKEGAEAIEHAKLGRDQLDIRPPQRSEDQRRLRQAITLIENERWHDAVEILQYLIDQDSDAFIVTPEREFISSQAELERLISELPEAGKRNYLNRFSVAAEDLLAAAQREHDESTLNEVSQRYLNTPAGQRALLELINSWIDRGELVSAAHGYWRLQQISDNSASKEGHLLRATKLLVRAGRADRAKEMIANYAGEDQALKTRLLGEIDGTTLVTGLPQQGITPYTSQHIGEANTNSTIKPVSIPKWTDNVVERYSVQEQIEHLKSDISEQGTERALIPTSQPIIVNDKLVYRSLRGLVVRDPTTGKVVWQTRPQNSPEQQLTPLHGDDEDRDLYDPKITPYDSNMLEHHTLANLLYRDSLYGCLTGSGTTVYSIENSAIIDAQSMGYSWRRQQDEVDQQEKSRLSTNELVAYDLSDGGHSRTPKWVLGGPQIEDQFSRRLAGTFFLGPPVADGDDLFVIGEQAEEVVLFCLSARTGDVLWRQTIAYPGQPIEQEFVRRHWDCLPVIQDGLVFCPTGCGWLVAVDRQTHSLRWASRYSSRQKHPQRYRGGFDVQNVQSLNVRWGPSMPIIVDGRIVVTPPEFPDEFGTKAMTVCLDQSTGLEVWNYPKGDELYLVGAFDGKAIVVSHKSVQARNVRGSGEIAWTCDFPDETGAPSGRGVIHNNQFLLPVGSRTLLIIDLKAGEIVETKTLHDSAPAWGNLLVHGSDLISLSSLDVMSVQSEGTPDSLAANKLSSLNVCLNEVEELRKIDAKGDALRVLQTFRQRPDFTSLSTLDRKHIEELEWEVLMQIASLNLSALTSEKLRIEQLADTPQRKLELTRLRANQLRSEANWKAATELYLGLLTNSSSPQWIFEKDKEVRIDCWVSGRLADLYSSLNTEERAAFDQLVRAYFQTANREIAKNVLTFSPVGYEFELEDAQTAEEVGRIGEALLLYERAAESEDAALRAQAYLGQAELLLKIEFYEDAQVAFEKLQADGETILPDNRTALEVAETGLQACRDFQKNVKTPQLNWSGEWEVIRNGSGVSRYSSSGSATRMMITPDGNGLQKFASKSYQFDFQTRRLIIEENADGTLYWNFPLMEFQPAQQHQNIGISWVGPLGFALHRGVLHGMDMPGKQVLWTHTPQIAGVAANRLRFPSTPQEFRMRPPNSIVAANRIETKRSTNGYLLAATSRCLLVMDKDLIGLDPLTGEVMWRIKEVSNRTVAHVFQNKLLVFGLEKQPVLIRLFDGKIVEEAALSTLHRECILLRDDSLVQLTQSDEKTREAPRGNNPPPNNQPNLDDYVVKSLSLDGESTAWAHSISGNSLLHMDGTTLVWIDSKGLFTALDLLTGSTSHLGNVPDDLLKLKTGYFLAADLDRYYVIASHGKGSSPHVSLNPVIRTRGTILAFAKSGGLLWTRPTTELGPKFIALEENPADDDPNQPIDPDAEPTTNQEWSLVMIVRELERSPVLVFVGDQYQRRNDLHFRKLQVVCLDKQTGERRLMWERPSDSGGFTQFHVDLLHGHLSLQTYNQQLKLKPVARQHANAGEKK